jgi:hypothetical protein
MADQSSLLSEILNEHVMPTLGAAMPPPVKEDETADEASSLPSTPALPPPVMMEDEASVHGSVDDGELPPAKIVPPRSTAVSAEDTLYSKCGTSDCNTLLSHLWDAESIRCPVCTNVFDARLLRHFARVDDYPRCPVPDGDDDLEQLRSYCSAKAQLKGHKNDPYLGGGSKRTHYRFGKAHTAFLGFFFNNYSTKPTNSMYQYLVRKLNQIQPDPNNITAARIRTWFKNHRFQKDLTGRLPGDARRKRKKPSRAESGTQLVAPAVGPWPLPVGSEGKKQGENKKQSPPASSSPSLGLSTPAMRLQ